MTSIHQTVAKVKDSYCLALMALDQSYQETSESKKIGFFNLTIKYMKEMVEAVKELEIEAQTNMPNESQLL